MHSDSVHILNRTMVFFYYFKKEKEKWEDFKVRKSLPQNNSFLKPTIWSGSTGQMYPVPGSVYATQHQGTMRQEERQNFTTTASEKEQMHSDRCTMVLATLVHRKLSSHIHHGVGGGNCHRVENRKTKLAFLVHSSCVLLPSPILRHQLHPFSRLSAAPTPISLTPVYIYTCLPYRLGPSYEWKHIFFFFLLNLGYHD